MTLLMFASSYGFEDIVEFLLKFNPNTELENKKGKTALNMAKENGHENILKRLKVNTKNK